MNLCFSLKAWQSRRGTHRGGGAGAEEQAAVFTTVVSSCPIVAQQLCNTLIPSSGNMCLHISEICFWHRRHVIPVLNFLLEPQEFVSLRYLQSCYRCVKASNLHHMMHWFLMLQCIIYFINLLSVWFCDIACLIHWIMQLTILLLLVSVSKTDLIA